MRHLMRQLMGINGEKFFGTRIVREMCFAVTAKVFGEKEVSSRHLLKTQKRGLQRCVRHSPLGVFSCHQNLRRF